MTATSTRKWIVAPTVSLCLAFWMSLAAQAQGPIHRLSAQFKNFDVTETTTPSAVPGINAYTKTVLVPSTDNTLYITISAVGDTHKGNAGWFSCNLDGDPTLVPIGAYCNPGSGGHAGAPAGWLSLEKHFNYDFVTYNGGITGGDGGGGNGDMHDNSIQYQWCVSVVPGSMHTVQIRLASSLTGGGAGLNNNVFFEAAHFYVDSSSTRGGCSKF